MLPNCTEYLIAQQALARMSATAVQIGYRLKAGEIAFILQNSQPIATIVHADFIAKTDSGTVAALLPEPGSLGILGVAATAGLFRRRRATV